jgi:hypothetical protein
LSLFTTERGILDVVFDPHILFSTRKVGMLFKPRFGATLSSFPFFATIAQFAVCCGSSLAAIAPTPLTSRPIFHFSQQIVQSLFKFIRGDCHSYLGNEISPSVPGLDSRPWDTAELVEKRRVPHPCAFFWRKDGKPQHSNDNDLYQGTTGRSKL